VSQFLSQYQNIRVIYHPGKDIVNTDAISRLHRIREDTNNNDNGDVFGFVVTVIGMSVKVLAELESRYNEDRHLKQIYENLKARLNTPTDIYPPDDTMVTFSQL
jgi:hypothetical protein